MNMSTLFSHDIRGKRLRITHDEAPEHPLNNTDAPFYVENYSAHNVYYRKHETKADRPTAPRFSRDTGYLATYFDSDGAECEYFNASGALYVDREEWLAYAGAPATRAMLRAQLAELAAYWHGDVYGYEIVKTFSRSGVVYETPEILDSCYGFYGASGLLAIASSLPESFAHALRKAVKSGRF